MSCVSLYSARISLLERAIRKPVWTVVEGEPGVGKRHLLHSAAGMVGTVDPVDTFECRDAAEPTDIPAAPLGRSVLMLEHVDEVSVGCAAACVAELRRRRSRGHCVIGTVGSLKRLSPQAAMLLDWFPYSVQVPPLRYHLDDLDGLLATLLERHGAADRRCSADVIQVLRRYPWPGNVDELSRVIETAVASGRDDVVTVDDLPLGVTAVTRRSLTTLEWYERDTIMRAVDILGQDRNRMAKVLGLSRSTLYRKLRDYGLSGASVVGRRPESGTEQPAGTVTPAVPASGLPAADGQWDQAAVL